MKIKPKFIKISKSLKRPGGQKEEGILYFFKNKAAVERCFAKKCPLVSKENAYEATDLKLETDLISSLAIEIWRLERRTKKIEKDLETLPDNNGQMMLDQIQRIKDVFENNDIKIRDDVNQSYDDGMSVKPLHFEEIDGLPKGQERIIETVKPSIYFKGKEIFTGQVIVGKSKEK